MNKNNSNFKAFNLQDALNGAKVVTRIGIPVKVITVTNDEKLLAQIEFGPVCRRIPEKFNLNGSKYSGSKHHHDLFMAA